MKISKENYEAWMLDYLEGRLRGKQLALFEQFLSEHPELREEAKGVEDMHLEADERFFQDKSRLKAKMLKQVIDEEELTCFEASEGMLASDKKERFEKRMLTSSRLQEKLDQYKQARLSPDENSVFENKAWLRRSEAPLKSDRVLWPYFVAAALLAGIVYFVIPTDRLGDPEGQKQPMAELVKDSSNLKKSNKVVSPQATTKVQEAAKVVSEAVNTPKNSSTPVQKAVKTAARLKTETLRPPKQDLAKAIPTPRPVNEQAVKADEQPVFFNEAQYAEAPAVKEVQPEVQPEPMQEVKTPVKPIVKPKPRSTPNKNFINSDAQLAAEQVADKKKFAKAGANFLAKITGNRLKIESNDAKKVSVTFESQLIGFSTTFD